jgi:ribonuclease G
MVAHPELDRFLGHHEKDALRRLARKAEVELRFNSDDNLHLNEFQFYAASNGKPLHI